MNSQGEESISLTSTSPYVTGSDSHSDSQISSFEPLLENDFSNTRHSRGSGWRSIFPIRPSLGCLKSRNDIGEKMRPGRRKGWRLVWRVLLGVFLVLYVFLLPERNQIQLMNHSGIIQLLSLVLGLLTSILPGGVHRIVKSWGRPGHIGAGLSSWPTDFSQDILPIPCHSHNDYWRRVPLYSALEVGCIGVEADIWLFEEQLYVGHSVASLTPNRTLNSLYINPLLDILEKQNPKHTIIPRQDAKVHGVFDTVPEQSLIFLIDFKTAGASLWPFLQSALEPLRGRNYLTRFDGINIVSGPITVVGTGNTPFDLVNSDESNPHHDIFFDAPLSDMSKTTDGDEPTADSSLIEALSTNLEPERSSRRSPFDGEIASTSKYGRKRSDQEGQGKSGIMGDSPDVFNTGNSYYASVAFGEAIGQLRNGRFSQQQMDLLRNQVQGAHQRGLKARYWDLPYWPISLRNHVWDVLVKEGVDMLNVDDLKGATKRNWDKHHGWWKRMKGASYNTHGGFEELVDNS